MHRQRATKLLSRRGSQWLKPLAARDHLLVLRLARFPNGFGFPAHLRTGMVDLRRLELSDYFLDRQVRGNRGDRLGFWRMLRRGDLANQADVRPGQALPVGPFRLVHSNEATPGTGYLHIQFH